MRRPVRLMLGTLPFELWPDGRVTVTLTPQFMPFGAAISATVLYQNLGAFLAAMRSTR